LTLRFGHAREGERPPDCGDVQHEDEVVKQNGNEDAQRQPQSVICTETPEHKAKWKSKREQAKQ
jgi:hypothetical protein